MPIQILILRKVGQTVDQLGVDHNGKRDAERNIINEIREGAIRAYDPPSWSEDWCSCPSFSTMTATVSHIASGRYRIMLILKVIEGPDKGKRYELPEWEPQLIGRSSEALQTSDDTCSRRHAELTPDNGNWYVRDLGSANGTYVNGRRIGKARVKLRLGDQLRAGSTVFIFGSRKYGPHNNPIRALRPEFMDAIVEQRIPSADDSVIMAVPDPSSAASEHLRVIYELTRLTSQTLDRDSLLELVMELIFNEFLPDRGFILITDIPGGKPEPVVVKYSNPPRNRNEKQIHVSRTIVNHVMENSEGILSSNAMKDRRFAAGDSVQNYSIRSAICVPIIYSDRTFGVIHIDTSLANYTFSDSQLQLLTAIGQHTGLALSSLELYKQHLHNARLAAIGETVASLSHSIKNILQGLRGGADVVGMSLKKSDLELARGGWDILSRNLDRIYTLTMNMLAFSKARRVEIELIEIAPLLDDVVELIQSQCDRRNVALITDFDRDIDPIPADSGAVHQVLMNVLTNALDAVESTNGVITLSAENVAGEESVLIKVGDNGPGIDELELPRVWIPFHSTKGIRGTGLGLSVSKKVVEEHHGQIEMTSILGEGTTVTMTLPTDPAVVKDPSETMTAAMAIGGHTGIANAETDQMKALDASDTASSPAIPPSISPEEATPLPRLPGAPGGGGSLRDDTTKGTQPPPLQTERTVREPLRGYTPYEIVEEDRKRRLSEGKEKDDSEPPNDADTSDQSPPLDSTE